MTEEELERLVDALEAEADEEADNGLVAATTGLLVVFAALWAQLGVLQLPQLRAQLVDLLDELPKPPDPDRILPIVAAAMGLGAAAAGAPGPLAVPYRLTVEIQASRTKTRLALDRARLLAGLVEDFDDIVRVAAAAREAARIGPRTARWVINRAIAEGVTAVCDRLGLSRRWVAERDACPRCRAFHHQIAAPGGLFHPNPVLAPAGEGPAPTPPLHPRCRCRCWPYRGNETTSAIAVAATTPRGRT